MQRILDNLRARREDDESGFTLIELMVVVLIIAILIAIAIPTFLGAKTRAQDKAAQSSLRNALTNAKGIYTDNDSYLTATSANLQLAEPSLAFVVAATASTQAKQVSVNPITVAGVTNSIVMTSRSASGVCFAIGDGATVGTAFARVATGACTAANAATVLGVVAAGAAGSTASATADTWVASF